MATDGYFNGATARRAVVRQGAPIVLGRSTFSYFQAGSPRSIWFGLVNAPPSDAPAAPPSNAPAPGLPVSAPATAPAPAPMAPPLIARSSCVVPHPTSTRAANAIAIPKRAVIIISSARIHRLAVEQDGFRLRSARSRRVGRANQEDRPSRAVARRLYASAESIRGGMSPRSDAGGWRAARPQAAAGRANSVRAIPTRLFLAIIVRLSNRANFSARNE